MRALVLAGALGACTDYAQVSLHDGPGNVDLGQPILHENGDPARYDPPTDPGAHHIALIAAPHILGGLGRHGAVNEPGLEFRFERSDEGPMAGENWGIGAGMAFAQFGDTTRTVAPGAFYAEVSYRVLIKNALPLDVSAGPVVYVDDASLGGQLTLRFLVFMFRSRYVANTGFEALGGLEIPIPFLFGWSK